MAKKKIVLLRPKDGNDYGLFYDTGNFTYYIYIGDGNEVHRHVQPDAGREEFISDCIDTVEKLHQDVEIEEVIITHDMVDEEAVRFHVPNDIGVDSVV